MSLFIPLILGTGREGRQTEVVAEYLFKKLHFFKLETELIDARHIGWSTTIPVWQNSQTTMKWRQIAARADGFFIVTPEYNHAYPGELKLLLDGAYDEYVKKPVAICATSSGVFGGARVIEALWPVVIELGLVPVKPGLNVPKVESFLGKDGDPRDADFNARSERVIEELLWFASTLKSAREKENN